MTATERARVYEHRVTRAFRANNKQGGVLIRFWIEKDPEFGGEPSFFQAQQNVDTVLRKADDEKITDFQKLADHILEHVRGISSVEICDHTGQGFCAHKDWP